MDISEFDFDLPEHLIAQTPLQDRSASRLLVLDRKTGTIQHRHFTDLVEYIQPGEALVVNDSKVLPARLIGTKADTGAKIEILLLKQLEDDRWETLVKPAKRVREGTRVAIGDGELLAIAEGETGVAGGRVFRLQYEGVLLEVLERLGEMPLPPYIKEQLPDRDRYQTVYARELGSAAAPTAGLHFTNELLDRLREKRVRIVTLTLHVGLGTFRPVAVENIEEHHMHAEYYELGEEAAAAIREVKRAGKRVFAVGTTSCRTLETIAKKYGEIRADSGWSELFIYPGFDFRVVDALITNFHLPKSTLVMLVSALAGQEKIMASYQEAIREQYRFFSFGDAMLII